MAFNNIISHSENGLLTDTFNKEGKIFPAKAFCYFDNLLLFNNENNVHLYNHRKMKKMVTMDINNVKQIKVNDFMATAFDYGKSLKIFFDEGVIGSIENVEGFEISENYIAVIKDSTLQIFDILKREPFADLGRVKAYFIFGTTVIYVKGSSEQKVHRLVCRDVETQEEYTIQIQAFEKLFVKASADYTHFLIDITTDYVSNSYFCASQLFFVNLRNRSHVILDYHHVHFYDFISERNNIIICHGNQPAQTVLLDYNMRVVKTYPKSIHNRVYFNPHFNLVCFAGFDNLSGNIEIHSNELLTRLSVVGASDVIWSPCGSYFMVVVSNRLKVNNNLTIYDYFGRKIKEMHFENLIDCCWPGDKTEFKALERPEVLNIPIETKYIPPHLRNEARAEVHTVKNERPKKENLKNSKKENVAKNKKAAPKKEEKAVDVKNLEQLLVEIKQLKGKILKGEDLPIEDYNKVFMEEAIQKQIEEYYMQKDNK